MGEGEETARLLARVPLFADLSEQDLRELAQVAVPRSYEAGELVFREGDTGDTCFVVRSGMGRVTRRHSDGRVITLTDCVDGALNETTNSRCSSRCARSRSSPPICAA